ncbi:MAG: hypothetical protein JW750_07985 [Anaerolineaceae bacterium]|nr:hypothetical protein [Anaerolineaceae bacterium]
MHSSTFSPNTEPAGQGHPRSLFDEIHMIRGIMQRVMALADEGRTLPELLRVLDTLSMASTRLATLLKTDAQFSKQEDVAAALNLALAELLDEMNPSAH